MLQIVMDALKIQPCYPSFLDARDAIIEADKLDYGGMNECLLWSGFARRGLGYSAARNGRESFDVPPGCRRRH